ncbi:MAG: hypothetical protein NC078_01470 [Ruminococcus sp.]|nr:hypothetical protein [Ruminococcus sp.]
MEILKTPDAELNALEEKVKKTELLRPGEYGKQKNTPARRKKLLQYLHRTHILRLWGRKTDDLREAMAIEELKMRVEANPDINAGNRENACAACIDGHSFAWNTARRHYERASKMLCQTIINFLEEAAEQDLNVSYIYTDEEMGRVFNAQKELDTLSASFADSLSYLISYDYTTRKFGEFWGFEEYSLLPPEHLRLAANLIPARLSLVEERYNARHPKKTLHAANFMKDPALLCREEVLAPLFEKSLALYDTPEDAYYDTANLVRCLNMLYRDSMIEVRAKS